MGRMRAAGLGQNGVAVERDIGGTDLRRGGGDPHEAVFVRRIKGMNAHAANP